MKINIKNNNDYEIKMTVELSWDDIKDDYNSQVNKELSNAKVKGARKGRLRGLQKELWLKNNNHSLFVHAPYDLNLSSDSPKSANIQKKMKVLLN